MQKNIDDNTRARRKNAWVSTLLSSIWPLMSTVLLLGLKFMLAADGILGTILVILALLNLCMLIPAWVNLIKQLKAK